MKIYEIIYTYVDSENIDHVNLYYVRAKNREEAKKRFEFEFPGCKIEKIKKAIHN